MEKSSLSDLPDDLILNCTSYLDVSSLLATTKINHKFKTLCCKNQAGWENLCLELWKDKVFVSPDARNQESSIDAYRLSVLDAKERQHLLVEELCYDCFNKRGPIWSFRFKESAGPDWTGWDPWWNGQPARQMIFLRDGTVQQYKSQDDSFETAPMDMRWRFSGRPMDLPERPEGSYIRFSVGGREVPTYVVRRSPTDNWGFIAESCWGVYTSFPMPLCAKPSPHDASWQLRTRSSQTRTEPDGSSAAAATTTTPPLTDDSVFLITNEVQWREALLYNFGATILPEGEYATQDFDRMFGQTVTALRN